MVEIQNAIFLSPSTQKDNKLVKGNPFNLDNENQLCNLITDCIVEGLKRSYEFMKSSIIMRNGQDSDLTTAVRSSNIGVEMNPDTKFYHLAIHTNAGGGRGFEVFCYQKFDNKGVAVTKGAEFASNILNSIKNIGLPNRGLKEGKDFYDKNKSIYELEHTKAPAALIELGFHDNLADMQELFKNLDKYVEGIVKAILKTFGIKEEVDWKLKYDTLKKEMSNILTRY